MIEDTALPLLQTLMRPPEDSPLSEVPFETVATYLAFLLSARDEDDDAAAASAPEEVGEAGASERGYFHERLAMSLTKEILADGENANVRSLCKTLNVLSLEHASQEGVKGLRLLASEASHARASRASAVM